MLAVCDVVWSAQEQKHRQLRLNYEVQTDTNADPGIDVSSTCCQYTDDVGQVVGSGYVHVAPIQAIDHPNVRTPLYQ